MKKLVFAGLLLLIGFAFWNRTRETPSFPTPVETSAPSPAIPAPSATPPDHPRVTPSSFVSPSASPSLSSIAQLAPQPESIRKQVKKDPHQTPQAILEFAASLGEKMDEAIAQPEKAEAFFKELRECVQDPRVGTTTSIQAICLSNARRLSQKIPALQKPYQSLSDSTPEALVRLIH